MYHMAHHIEQTVLATKIVTAKQAFTELLYSTDLVDSLLVVPDRVIQCGLNSTTSGPKLARLR